MLVNLIESVYRLLWGDLFTIPLGGGIGISFMVVLLFTAGIWFTCRTRLLPVRLFRDMLAAVCEKNDKGSGLSSFQTLVVSTATRVGMGNLIGVVAAISAGGPGAIFWMWLAAFFGMATIYGEAYLAQISKRRDESGEIIGGPVYYITHAFKGTFGKALAGFFAVAVILALGFMGNMVQSNSISDAFYTAFSVPKWVMGVIVAVMAPMGDLFESYLKRACDVKDSGNILPGHGGMMDRFDSLLFVAPAVLLFLSLIRYGV